MNGIKLRDITLMDRKPGNYPALTIYIKGCTITGMKIAGFIMNGEIKGTGGHFTIDAPANVEYTIE